MKRILMFAAALLSASAAYAEPANTETGIPPEARPEIVQVTCIGSMGSAFYVGPNLLLSVRHVTDHQGCFVNGQPFDVIKQDGDFSILRVKDSVSKWLRIDCSGFKAGRLYTATGFARGLPFLTSVDSIATGKDLLGFSVLWGVFNVIPGMSGGTVEDPETGKVVGTVNTYNAAIGNSGSVELRKSPVCRS